MGCLRPEKEIGAYIDGELEFAKSEAMKMHLQRCGRCRRIEARLRQAKDVLLVFKNEGLPADFKLDMADMRAQISFGQASFQRLKLFIFASLFFCLLFLALPLLYRPAATRLFPLVGETIVSNGPSAFRMERWASVVLRKGDRINQESGKLAIIELEKGAFILLKEKASAVIVSNRHNRLTGSSGYVIKLTNGSALVWVPDNAKLFSLKMEAVNASVRPLAGAAFYMEEGPGYSLVQAAKGRVVFEPLSARYYRVMKLDSGSQAYVTAAGVRTGVIAGDTTQAMVKELESMHVFLKNTIIKPAPGLLPVRGREVDYWGSE
ncbi:MAG: hypothetical protein AUJ89_05520 [Candidatus Omnitrophica bacterium CG1_02_43_210]|nr:MAG: hypothetical protein AUJ89_05520 [Candidatus Omnitrophica bacterium CG1_02_43_210]PIV38926.1 MAG: hypothetical protein COS29_05260 [Candidatus Omnitrophica bacterium CG02_land_8_20_14_3_00__42_8]